MLPRLRRLVPRLLRSATASAGSAAIVAGATATAACGAPNNHEDKGCSSNGRPPIILGFGNPTVDVTVTVSSAEMDAVGLRPGTETAGQSQVIKQQIVDVALAFPAERRETTPGGAALNAMRVAAWRAGTAIRVAFVGSVGTDEHAEVLVSAMAAVGVEPLLLRDPTLPTGLCASLVEAESKDRALSVVKLMQKPIAVLLILPF